MWKKNHKLKANKWIMAYQKRWRDVGACVRCGKPTPINPKTGKPFQECFKHRLKAAKNQAKHYDKNAERIKAYKINRRNNGIIQTSDSK